MLLRVNVDNPADKITEFGAGAKLYWYRDNTSATGAFTDATGSVTLVATQTQYEIVDTTGAVGHYYRTRIGNTGATLFDTYAPVFQAGAPTAYATLDALRERVQAPNDTRDNLLSDILLAVTERITNALGFDLFRHPAVSGTEIVTYDGRGSSLVISDQQGFASVTLVRIAYATGQTYTSLASTGWFLRNPVRPGGPYLDLELSDVGSYYFYAGFSTAEVTGVRGYLSIPADITEATLQWSADLYRIGASGGSPLGATGLGATEGSGPTFIGGMPRFAWEVVEDYKKRHAACLVA